MKECTKTIALQAFGGSTAMPYSWDMTEKQLQDRDRDVWKETIDAVNDLRSGRVGTTHHVEVPPVVEARQRAGLSQARFANMLGVSVRTLQDWEQGRRKPSGAAESLIKIAEERPDVLRELFG